MEQRNCVVCGDPLTGRKTKLCGKRACRNKRNRTTRDPAKAKAERRRQALKSLVLRDCTVCGKPTLKDRSNRRRVVCSYKCRWFVQNDGASCDIPETHPSRSSPLPPDHPARTRPRKPTFTMGYCQQCGSGYVDRWLADMSSRYCGSRCAKAAGRSRRRARKRGAFVADVRPSQIHARDRWRCGLCGALCDKSKSVPHPRAPTIDHIIPLAAGGTHEPSNVQTACFGCNCRKSNGSLGPEQLRLVG